MTKRHGKDHAYTLLFQTNTPKSLGLINGFYSIEAYPGQSVDSQTVAIKPVFCKKLSGRLCDPNHVDNKTPPKSIQAVVVENNTATIKVVQNANQVIGNKPIFCANCPINRQN